MRIELLADYEQYVPVIAGWIFGEWGYLSPEKSQEQHAAQVHANATKQAIPRTFIALDEEKPVGVASLVDSDLETHTHLRPWLANLYVPPSFRKRGIGTNLVNRVVDETRKLGYPTLFLWTPDKEAYYYQRGWRVIDCTLHKNKNIVVMMYTTGV